MAEGVQPSGELGVLAARQSLVETTELAQHLAAEECRAGGLERAGAPWRRRLARRGERRPPELAMRHGGGVRFAQQPPAPARVVVDLADPAAGMAAERTDAKPDHHGPGMRVEESDGRFEVIRRQDVIVGDERDERSACRAPTEISRRGDPAVRLPDVAETRLGGGERRHQARGLDPRAVVGDDDLERRGTALAAKRFEAARQLARPVVGQHDDRHPRRELAPVRARLAAVDRRGAVHRRRKVARDGARG